MRGWGSDFSRGEEKGDGAMCIAESYAGLAVVLSNHSVCMYCMSVCMYVRTYLWTALDVVPAVQASPVQSSPR